MNKKAYFVLVLIIICSKMFSQDLNKETITWYVSETPPVFINSGEFVGKGSGDRQCLYLQALLKNFDHIVVKANNLRIESAIESGEKAISLGILKTPGREKRFLFSKPYCFTIPNILVVLKKNKNNYNKYIDLNGKINFDSLLKNENITLGVTKGRVYLEPIQSFLKDNENSQKVYYRSAYTGNSEGLLAMLEVGRLDCVILYPFEVEFLIKSLKLKNVYDLIPIQGYPDFIPVYTILPKTEWGEKMLIEINRIYSDRKNIRRFYEFNKYWASSMPESLVSGYQKKFEASLDLDN